MKKILFILEGADGEDVRRFQEGLREGEIAIINDQIKIFQLDNNEIKRVYPEILREKTKIGELEISTERPETSEEEKATGIYSDDPRLKSKEIKKPKRKRRTKTEMKSNEEHKEPSVRKKRKNLLFSKEVDNLIKENWKDKRDKDLIEMIKEDLDQTFTIDQIKAHRKQIGCVKIRGGQPTRVKKKIGKPKKYTDEVVQFLKENVNNFSNKELCEELEHRFNIKIKSDPMSNLLCQKGIKRDNQPDMDPEIVDFILKSKLNDVYYLRDKIIEKFEKDIQTAKLRNVINQRKKKLPGEDVEDEVKRIKEQREQDDDDFADELELD